MAQVLSIDLAYKTYRNFGFCLIEEAHAQPTEVRFLTASDLNLEDPPNPQQFARMIDAFCREHGVRVVLLDGPQAWKDPNSDLKHSRLCERVLNTPAKTGIEHQVKPKNFTHFVEFSISIFSELIETGAVLVEAPSIGLPSNRLLVAESYPRSAWQKLGISPLPGKKKATPLNLQERLQALKKLYGFHINREPTHDELCALVGGIAGVAILTGNSHGYIAEGTTPRKAGGVIIEGFIVNPRKDPALAIAATTDNGRRTTDRATA